MRTQLLHCRVLSSPYFYIPISLAVATVRRSHLVSYEVIDKEVAAGTLKPHCSGCFVGYGYIFTIIFFLPQFVAKSDTAAAQILVRTSRVDVAKYHAPSASIAPFVAHRI